MPVTHCICANQSFNQLKQLAQRERLNLAQLARRTGAGQGCGLCRPYLQRMLATGQCTFEPAPADAGAKRRVAPDRSPGRDALRLSTFAQPARGGGG